MKTEVIQLINEKHCLDDSYNQTLEFIKSLERPDKLSENSEIKEIMQKMGFNEFERILNTAQFDATQALLQHKEELANYVIKRIEEGGFQPKQIAI